MSDKIENLSDSDIKGPLLPPPSRVRRPVGRPRKNSKPVTDSPQPVSIPKGIRVSDDLMPRLPDGSFFEDVRTDFDMAQICRTTLEGFMQAYQFGSEHSLALRILLQTLIQWYALINSKEAKSLSSQQNLAEQMMKIQDKLGVLKKTGTGYDPFTLWDSNVAQRAIPYMKEHGLGTSVACPTCHTIVLPFIHSLPVKCVACGHEVLWKGMKHPWINWDQYPIWSPKAWMMTQSKCGHTCTNCGTICSKTKLTHAEAAWLLDVSEVGFDQVEQLYIGGTPIVINDDGSLGIDLEKMNKPVEELQEGEIIA